MGCRECQEPGVVCKCALHRRDVLKGITSAAAVGMASVLGSRDIVQPVSADDARVDVEDVHDDRHREVFEAEENADPDSVFPQSVCSGGPTRSGVILWTRVAPDAHEEDVDLGLEVATDDDFAEDDVVYRGVVDSEELRESRDYVAQVDLDGQLLSDTFYHYRFVYDGVRTRTGRCRTLPATWNSPDQLSFAIANCNHYQNGYFHAFDYIADENADYLLHMGDLIYEPGNSWFTDYRGVRYDREIELDSGNPLAQTLDDFRELYKIYKQDRSFQRALENHTVITIMDDHELADDRYWDYQDDEPIPGPWARHNWLQNNFLEQTYQEITVDGLQAWAEHVPNRVEYDPDADHIHDQFQLWHNYEMGDLINLVATDGRLYREEPPCGNLEMCEGESVLSDDDDPNMEDRTMLGSRQRNWFLNQIEDTDSQWLLWMNNMLAQPLTISARAFGRGAEIEVINDAWDGYRQERQQIVETVDEASVENFVALSGDMHATIVGHLQTKYPLSNIMPERHRVGVEFLTPAMTSENVGAYLEERDIPKVPKEDMPDWLYEKLDDNWEEILSGTLHRMNPHLEFADWHHHGYARLDVDRDGATFTVFTVDKEVSASSLSDREVLISRRTPAGEARIEPSPVAIFSSSAHEIEIGDSVEFDASRSEPAADADRIDSYEWDFGDGETASGETVEHQFGELGDHRVTVRVTDDEGKEDVATAKVEVNGQTPEAVLDVDGIVRVGEKVEFDASESTPGSGDIDFYAWNLGNGNEYVSAEPETVTIYENPGTKTVEMTVVDENRLSDTATETIEVIREDELVCGDQRHEWSAEGTLEEYNDVSYHRYEPQTDEPCGVTLQLHGVNRRRRGSLDLDLYVTVDGRKPRLNDYDAASLDVGSDQLLLLDESQIDSDSDVRILVHSYRGRGDYTLELTEAGTNTDDDEEPEEGNEGPVDPRRPRGRRGRGGSGGPYDPGRHV